eukprot:1489842-Pyramimonas_sp.AAC.3
MPDLPDGVQVCILVDGGWVCWRLSYLCSKTTGFACECAVAHSLTPTCTARGLRLTWPWRLSNGVHTLQAEILDGELRLYFLGFTLLNNFVVKLKVHSAERLKRPNPFVRNADILNI